ncbi:hypothetical protein PQQ99_28125 [Paraburkholderia sediminicola]|uniref:hypothetical protein n=1 Tax=Paraburkholderia sediminicola TaxID=458836 RepID=UPI0038B9AB29
MNTALIPLTSATVLRGQRAWGRIKATAAEQRQLWKEVGEALMVGRKENTSNQAFGKWCAEMGFDMKPDDRSNAMWLAENWSVLESFQNGETHPKGIRQAFNEAKPVQPPTPEVDLSTSPTPRARISIETAKKVNKLASMAECGEGQEQQTARKYLKKQAEKFGMEPGKLAELAAKTDPTNGVGPDQSVARDQNLTTIGAKLAEIAAFLKLTQAMNPEAPLTREVVIALLDQVCDQHGII